MQAGRRKGKVFRPRLYIYYMFNIGINSSALGIIVHYTIPPPGFTFPQMVHRPFAIVFASACHIRIILLLYVHLHVHGYAPFPATNSCPSICEQVYVIQ